MKKNYTNNDIALKDERDFSLLFSLNNPVETGFILQVFELAKTIAKKGLVKFRSHGTCMYPCIKPGDTLHIEPKNAEQIKIGNVAVYRRCNRLFSHRTIDKGKDNGLYYIFTRPDTAESGREGPIFDENILGIVSTIERDGKIFKPVQKSYPLDESIVLKFLLKLYQLKHFVIENIAIVITYIQPIKIYRRIARFLFSRTNNKLDFSILVPLKSKKTNRFYQKFSFQEFAAQHLNKKGNLPSKWLFVLNMNSKEAAFLSFIYKPQIASFPGWWILDDWIRISCRGTGIEEKMLDQVDNLFGQMGISRIYLHLYQQEKVKKKLFNSLGFKEKFVHSNQIPNKECPQLLQGVIMERIVKRVEKNE